MEKFPTDAQISPQETNSGASIESPNEREVLLKQKMAELNETTDLLGLEIEPGIKETVAYLNLLGIETSSSCGGHDEEDSASLPYVQGHAKNEPLYRYVGEDEIVKAKLTKYGLKKKNELFSNQQAEEEYYSQIDQAEESPEYVEWYAKNAPLEKQAESMVAEFNETNPEYKLHTVPHYPGYRVEVDFGYERNNDIGKEQVKDLVSKAQKTFKEFEAFLKNKFLVG